MHKEDVSYDKEDLKVIIDDSKIDISVLDYITIKEKYDLYLRTISYLDNFISFEHLQSVFKDKISKTKLFNDLNVLCELSFVRKIFVGRNSYYILTRKSKTYLNKRNEHSYIENPSNKKLLKNLLIFDHLIAEKGKKIDYENCKDYKGYVNINFDNQIEKSIDFNKYNLDINESFYYQLNKMNLDSYFIENGSIRYLDQMNLLKESKSDILSDLNKRNYYINKFYIGDKKLLLEIFFIDNENIKSSKYLSVLFMLENNLKKLYFKPGMQAIKYNLKIITKDAFRKNLLEKSLKKLIEERLINKETVLNTNSNQIEGRKNLRSVAIDFTYNLEQTLWAINEVSVITYNTERFFYTANDSLKKIKAEELNILNLIKD